MRRVESQELVLLVAEQATHAFVPARGASFQVHHENRIVLHLLDECAKALFACFERAGRLLPGEDQVAGLVLPRARAKGSLGRRHEGNQGRRSLKQRDIAEILHGLAQRRVFRTLARNENDRQVRPRGLVLHVVDERPNVVEDERFFGQDDRAGAAAQFMHEPGDAVDRQARDALLREHLARQLRILSGRRPHQNALFEISRHRATPLVSRATPVPSRFRSSARRSARHGSCAAGRRRRCGLSSG
jgi:hypothetical protein